MDTGHGALDICSAQKHVNIYFAVHNCSFVYSQEFYGLVSSSGSWSDLGPLRMRAWSIAGTTLHYLVMAKIVI